MKTILLTAINARYSHSNPAVHYLKSFISDMGHDVRIQDFTTRRPPEEIANEIAAQNPDVAGFSVYIWNADIMRELVTLVRALCPDTKIVLGGPEVSGDPDAWLRRHPEIDYIVAGPGERGFRHLLENNLNLREKVVHIPNPPFAEIPFPYSEEDMPKLRRRYIYYESSRGCPFRCTYCISSRNDQAPDYRAVETVKHELDRLLSHGPDYIKFVDRTFNSKKSHYREIWKYLIEKYSASSTVFHFEIFPATLDDADFDILSNCPRGLFQFEIGIQSVNSETIRAVHRTGEWPQIEHAARRLISMDLFHVHVDMIVGLPNEDMAGTVRSFNMIYGLRADHFQVGFLKILSGTEMAENAKDYGMEYTDTPPYQVTGNRWLSRENIRLMQGTADMVDSLYNRGKFIYALENLEDLFPSPFDLYSSLVPPSMPVGREHISMAPEKGAALLLDLAEKTAPSRLPFFRDCLRWDWCRRSGSGNIPGILRSGSDKGIRKELYDFISGRPSGESVLPDDHDFTKGDIKMASLFRADTEEFRSRYMQAHSTAIFLPGGRVIFLTT